MLTVLTSEDPQQSTTYLEDVTFHLLAFAAAKDLIAFTVLYQKDQRTMANKFLTRNTVYKKGNAVPLQAWSGPEGSRKLSFPDYMTTAQVGGKVVSLTHRPPLPPGNAPGTHFYYRLSRP
jgi:hypothetical protein